MVPRTLKHLCQETRAADPLMVETSLMLATWLVSGKSFCVKEFQKTLLTFSQIPDEKAHSLILSQPEEMG